MKLDSEHSANNPAVSAARTGLPFSSESYSDLFSGYQGLTELCQQYPVLALSRHPSRMPLSHAGVEMLEAELQNQGVLPYSAQGSLPLSYRLGHEVSFFRWKARSHGLFNRSTIFAVSLPAYVIQTAGSMLHRNYEGSSGSVPLRISLHDTRFNADELNYFNCLAAYLAYPDCGPSNRFKKGLDLIIYSILRTEQVDCRPKNVVLLPTRLKTYLNQLRQSS